MPIHTYLIGMIVRSSISITDTQLYCVLGIQKLNSEHVDLFSSIVQEVQKMVSLMLREVGRPLDEFPLTNIKDMCFRVARGFPSLFFVASKRTFTPQFPPRRRNAFSRWESRSSLDSVRTLEEETCEIVTLAPRFNQMWPVAMILKREYETRRKKALTR
ncbi:uncharacterized protein CANTADRAFT_46046 [Suhomyces tanzawaensis NRRL Y-17324]|uniref:Uncharacterized protein n=1 Tax=Suhomyces tanzawaensis NRRL Y-17324 TaxID=984487 RepID=A0A1E4SS98_9ASCO|nr:uncharacterized protein CANTADRAFT_46046 [Suhomyces tanzawaensis NRRL Y-17324]ODV82390.1 hypothetical protein CANTADRAFT_46046 [Suhomyces tanzawaensis NRRL Y-17324]